MHVEYLPKNGRPNQFTLYINEEAYCDIHTKIFGKNPKFSLKGNSVSELTEDFHDQEYSNAKRYIFKRLAVKYYHSRELAKILQNFLVSEPTIQRILEKCQTIGFINDQEWVESFIRCRQKRNSGPQEMARKLREKKVPEIEIHQALKKLDNPQLQQQRILTLLTSRYRTRDLKNGKEKHKVIGSLFRRGFDLDQIHETLKSLC